MPILTLDEINNETDKKYEPVTVPLGEAGEAKLMHPFMLPKERRAKFQKFHDEFSKIEDKYRDLDESTMPEGADPEAEMLDLVNSILKTVIIETKFANALIKALGGSLPHTLTLFQHYMQAVQAGEASSSSDS